MAELIYHLRQASTLTRYARLTRNPERSAELLRMAEQHKKLAEQSRDQDAALIAPEQAVSTRSCTET